LIALFGLRFLLRKKSNPTYQAGIATHIFDALNSITTQAMLDDGRVYGGGLHKLEPKELSNINATPLLDIFGCVEIRKMPIQQCLFN
jgi:hypothetical protein